MTDMPNIARKVPCPVEVEQGMNHVGGACGQSKSRPFCDGSHNKL